MGRQTQITKEQILQAGLRLVIDEGYEAVTITRVAERLKCSTQPIAWHFGNMANFKYELFDYALGYLNGKMVSDSNKPLPAFGKVGTTYIQSAFEEPNLLRFLFSNHERLRQNGGIGGVFKVDFDIPKRTAEELKCSLEDAKRIIKSFVAFTQGIINMLLLDKNLFTASEAQNMLAETAIALIMSLGYTKNEAIMFFVEN